MSFIDEILMEGRDGKISRSPGIGAGGEQQVQLLGRSHMRKLLVASLLMMMPLAAFSANKIEGYYVPTTSLDDGTDDEDGDGFGLRGEFNVAKNWLLEGEWQTATYDFGVDVDLSDLRLGGGFTTEGPIRFAAIAEYVRWNIDADIAGADDATADGFGVQGGCRATSTR